MKKVELRFNETEIYDNTAFLVWLSTCEIRLHYFECFQDNKTRDYVVRLMGKPEDIKHCLEQLGLKTRIEERQND